MCCAVFLVQIVKNMVSMDQKHVLMLVSHLVASQPNLDTLPSGVVKLLCKKQDTGSLLAGIQSKNALTGPFVRCLVQSLSQNLEKDLHRRLLLDLAQKVDLGWLCFLVFSVWSLTFSTMALLITLLLLKGRRNDRPCLALL